MQEGVGEQLPRPKTRPDAAGGGGQRPQSKGDDDAGRDALQQEHGDVGDDQRGGDGRHGSQMGPQCAPINGEYCDCAPATDLFAHYRPPAVMMLA